MTLRRKARLVDVALAAGVSPATVSRAMAQPELLSEETLSRVHASARQLGYSPNGMARALASGRTMTIGAVVPTLDSTIFARVLQSMQSTLAREGFQLLVASHEMNPAAETEALRMLIARGVDGLMLVGAERAREATALLRICEVPVVLTWCGNAEFAAVTVDNERAGALAAEHLLALGHRSIGMVVGRLPFNDRQSGRVNGARAAMLQAGLELPDQLVSQQDLTLAGGRNGCAALLDLAKPPTAIIGGIDIFAIGCIQEAQSRNLNVPDALSVVGIDNIDMSAQMMPPLTTVHIPTAQIGQMAATTLMAQIQGRAAVGQVELPIELVVRRSAARVL
ncbi:MAG: LacI family DNA-binding transcriptional regulator [Bosea sp. (in: a-proteobacteria)]